VSQNPVPLVFNDSRPRLTSGHSTEDTAHSMQLLRTIPPPANKQASSPVPNKRNFSLIGHLSASLVIQPPYCRPPSIGLELPWSVVPHLTPLSDPAIPLTGCLKMGSPRASPSERPSAFPMHKRITFLPSLSRSTTPVCRTSRVVTFSRVNGGLRPLPRGR